jgi:hypothetical protein
MQLQSRSSSFYRRGTPLRYRSAFANSKVESFPFLSMGMDAHAEGERDRQASQTE